MTRFALTLIIFLTLCLFSGAKTCAETDDVLYQYSTINALLNGLYDGDMQFAELKKHGDIGLGTFNGLDGEMIALDGAFYQIRIDGRAYPVPMLAKTPFAVVTFFDSDAESTLPANLDLTALKKHLSSLFASSNDFQAIRIDGAWTELKTRSVPVQKRPYVPLAEVVEQQTIFHFSNVEGTLIGFYTPDYVTGLNVPGFHFHFLTSDRSGGGHVLGLLTGKGTIRIDEIKEFMMELPESSEFATADLSGARKIQLEKVEKQHE